MVAFQSVSQKVVELPSSIGLTQTANHMLV